jgi:hypothetical protein
MAEHNDDWDAMTDVLGELGPADRLLADEPLTAEAARAYFRWLFAALEAFTFCLKRITLDLAAREGIELSPREREVLTSVKQPTFPGLAPRRVETGMRESFGVALNVYARACRRTLPLKDGRLPDVFFDVWTLHDRLSHPESPDDLEVTKTDLSKLAAFIQWFATIREWLYRDREDPRRRRRRRR